MNPAKDLPSTETTVDVRKKFYEGLLLQELKTHMNTQREYKNDLIDNWSGDAEADWFAAHARTPCACGRLELFGSA